MLRTFYIFSPVTLSRKENTLCLITKDQKRYLPIVQVEQIYIFSEVTLNTKLLNFLSQNGVLVHFFNYYGFYTGTFYPRETHLSGALLVEQVKTYLSPLERLHLAREIVGSAIHNLHRILEKREFQEEVEFLKTCEEETRKVESINELMLIEAKARKKYYSTFERITGWEFKERTFRPPENPLNALISFGNAMLYTTILKEIYNTPLNPTISYLHEPSERRFSLALDIAEIFKPILVDKLIFRLINNKVIRLEHFVKDLNFSYLTEEGRKIFVKNFDEMLESTILHRKLKRKVKYKTLIKLELYKLIKHLLGEKKFKGLRAWW